MSDGFVHDDMNSSLGAMRNEGAFRPSRSPSRMSGREFGFAGNVYIQKSVRRLGGVVYSPRASNPACRRE